MADCGKPTDVRVVAARLYLLPIETRMPLKFGRETVTKVTCARACVTVEDQRGRRASGWGETPLAVQWGWPAPISYDERHDVMTYLCDALCNLLVSRGITGHPIEIGHHFLTPLLQGRTQRFNVQQGKDGQPTQYQVPKLARLICGSVFDQAVHDAYGALHGVDVYQTYNGQWMNADLAAYLEPAKGNGATFSGLYPQDFFERHPPKQLRAWHLVGGLDPIDRSELTGDEPDDGYPVLLADWIKRDGLKCLKIKLRGDDAAWDYERVLRVGRVAIEQGVEWLSADFNCTVTEPEYVEGILDQLRRDEPRLFEMLLYVEQPFPYELEDFPIDVHSVSERKPLFLDESAHDWQHVRQGRELGWTGVALKTCKTQTGALLSMAWAKAHGMPLMVQDLTNPMLAMIPHVRLAAHAGTIMGVETNAMQFYPQASRAEAAVHPGLYTRRGGLLDLSTISGPGFGYRIEEIKRELPEPMVEVEEKDSSGKKND
jgi:L-alanine-DL-glutamate epimerase-like enolase superfamily enzyme